MTRSKQSEIRSYGNFRNPLGLVYRMLTSGSRAAWSALIREGLSIGTRPLDAMLSSRESRRIASTEQNDIPLVLIVGPPRSGTTLLYQVLSHCLDVSFPSNRSALFPRASLTMNGGCHRAPSNFQSYFGQTAGLDGPNDAFHIWNRWLGDDRYTTKKHMSEQESQEMRQFFSAWTSRYQKPFLNKNNRNVDAMSYLAEQLPNAYFVAVLRNPMCVARSLIHAREVVQGDRRVGWGLQCQEEHGRREPLGYVNDVCDQVRRNEADLKSRISDLDADRVLLIQYEAFCRDPDRCIDDIVALVPGLNRRPGCQNFGTDCFQISESQLLSPEVEKRLQENFSTLITVGQS